MNKQPCQHETKSLGNLQRLQMSAQLRLHPSSGHKRGRGGRALMAQHSCDRSRWRCCRPSGKLHGLSCWLRSAAGSAQPGRGRGARSPESSDAWIVISVHRARLWLMLLSFSCASPPLGLLRWLLVMPWSRWQCVNVRRRGAGLSVHQACVQLCRDACSFEQRARQQAATL